MARKPNLEKKVQQLFDLFDEIDTIKNNAQSNLSKADNELSDLYHYIEGVDIKHVAQSHNLIKELKTVLYNRREAKKEAMLSQSIIDNVKGAINTAKKRSVVILDKHKAIEDEIKQRAKEDKRNK